MTVGVLLINLGTPSALTTQAVHDYLAEFLSDRYVVDLPPLLWQPLLKGILLKKRPSKTLRLYEKIWTQAGSPLLVTSQTLATKLATKLQPSNYFVTLAMRYGQPSMQNALQSMQAKQINQMIVVPLFPQYSRAATESVIAKLNSLCKTLDYHPSIKLIKHYATEPAYINVIAQQITHHWQQQPRGQHLLFSFHGLPKKSIAKGDPYYQQCHTSATLIAKQLGLNSANWQVTFQSRFGPAKWLEPYTNKTLIALAQQQVKQVDIICPGFAVDCLETLEEINQQNRQLFLDAGGEQLNYIPALNDSPTHIELLQQLIVGWRRACEAQHMVAADYADSE